MVRHHDSEISHLDPTTIGAATQTLNAMKEMAVSIVYAALLTDDGFEIVHLQGSTTNGDRFASISSSIQALGDAVARELRIGSSEYIIIASDLGHVIQLRVDSSDIVLVALFDTGETLGKALSITRLSARHMSELLARARKP